MSIEKYEGPLQPLPFVMYLVCAEGQGSYMGRLYDDPVTALRSKDYGEVVVQIDRSLVPHPLNGGTKHGA